MAFDLSWIRNFYPSESILIWLQTKFYENESGTIFLDRWILIHAGSGALLAFFVKRPLWALGILILFELAENFYGVPNGLAMPETFWNSIIDIGASMAGWFLADKYIT